MNPNPLRGSGESCFLDEGLSLFYGIYCILKRANVQVYIYEDNSLNISLISIPAGVIGRSICDCWLAMKYCLRINEFWPKGLSQDKAAEEMNEMGISLLRGTIGNVLRNKPTRGDYATPFKFAKYLSWKLGRKVSITDLLVPIEEDE